jgi:hypothetical protein
MTDFCREFCWTVKRFFPLALSLIFLGVITKEFKEILPPILESGYVEIIQYGITAGIIVYAARYIRKIKPHVKIGLTRNQKISFGIALSLALIGEAGANSLATNIFLLNLFAITYMPHDPIRDQLLVFSDYAWGLLIVPFAGWYNFWIMRRYLTEKLEDGKCSMIVCWCKRNWIWTSLFACIIVNLGLIFV